MRPLTLTPRRTPEVDPGRRRPGRDPYRRLRQASSRAARLTPAARVATVPTSSRWTRRAAPEPERRGSTYLFRPRSPTILTLNACFRAVASPSETPVRALTGASRISSRLLLSHSLSSMASRFALTGMLILHGLVMLRRGGTQAVEPR